MYRIGQEEIDAFARAILSRDFFKINGSGQEVLHFEEEWGRMIGALSWFRVVEEECGNNPGYSFEYIEHHILLPYQ